MELADLPLVLASVVVALLCLATAAKLSIGCGLNLRQRGVPWPIAVLAVLGLYTGAALLLNFVAAMTWTFGMPIPDVLGLERQQAGENSIFFFPILASMVTVCASTSAAVTVGAFVVFDRRGHLTVLGQRVSTYRRLATAVAMVALCTLLDELVYTLANGLVDAGRR